MDFSYKQVIDYILDIPRFTSKTELKNTEIILEELGKPDKIPRAVHIAGTNGKGSVAKLMSLILEEEGYKTGLFTSPHLVRVNERITINGEEISDADMVHQFCIIKDAVDRLQFQGRIVHPAFFEFVFLMAANYFATEGCDYVVYETGLGGRLDATNVIVPEVSIITSIGLDHMQYLGNTIPEIAAEKAGIIKTGVPVVYNTGEKEADRVIEERAKELGSPSLNVVEYIDNIKRGISADTKTLIESQNGTYQIDNCYTALQAAEVLGCRKAEKALPKFTWPGRMEYLADNILIDGAHNVDAINRFVESVKKICKRDGWKRLSLLFAVSSDKDYRDIIDILTDNLDFEYIYIGEISSDRRTDAAEVLRLFQAKVGDEKHFSVVASKDMKNMWDLAVGELEKDTLLLVVGSLYMVGEIKSFIN